MAGQTAPWKAGFLSCTMLKQVGPKHKHNNRPSSCKKGYLSHRQTANAQASLCIHAVSPEPLLFARAVMFTKVCKHLHERSYMKRFCVLYT